MATPHKHAEVIKAWADNQTLKIEYRNPRADSPGWRDVVDPGAFSNLIEYRIKPAELELSFPQARAAIATLERMGYTFHGGELWAPPIGMSPAQRQLVGDVVGTAVREACKMACANVDVAKLVDAAVIVAKKQEKR